MRFTLSISMDNESFGDSPEERAAEVARILRKAADRLSRDSADAGDSWSLLDLNGNKVGRAEVVGD